jgi:hypothetical protein
MDWMKTSSFRRTDRRQGSQQRLHRRRLNVYEPTPAGGTNSVNDKNHPTEEQKIIVRRQARTKRTSAPGRFIF